MLSIAAEIGLRPETTRMKLEDANIALANLRAGRDIRGATVLTVAAP